MNLFSEIRALVLAALEKMTADGQLPTGLSFDAVAVEPPPKEELFNRMAKREEKYKREGEE